MLPARSSPEDWETCLDCARAVERDRDDGRMRRSARFDSCSARRENARGLECGTLLLGLCNRNAAAGRSRFVVWALAEAVTGAWFAGDDRARQVYAEALRGAVLQYGAGGLVHFAAMPSREQKPSGAESPRWLAVAYLSAACAAATWEQARELATEALVAAINAGEPFLQVLAHLASAEFNENARHEHFRQALQESRKVDSPSLASAVRAVIANEEHAGMLQSLRYEFTQRSRRQ